VFGVAPAIVQCAHYVAYVDSAICLPDPQKQQHSDGCTKKYDIENVPLVQIDSSHRITKPRPDGKPRPIIIKFWSYIFRNSVISNKTNLNLWCYNHRTTYQKKMDEKPLARGSTKVSPSIEKSFTAPRKKYNQTELNKNKMKPTQATLKANIVVPTYLMTSPIFIVYMRSIRHI